MIKIYFNEEFRLVDREVPPSIVQYSTEDIEVYTKFTTTHSLEYNFVRADGKQLNPVGLTLDRVEGEYDVWVSDLTQFHTAYMPGTADSLVALISFLARDTNTGAVKNSPIVRLNITRGIEPLTEAIEVGTVATLNNRMTEVETMALDHATKIYVDEEIGASIGIKQIVSAPLTELQILTFLYDAENGIYKVETERNGSEMLFKSVVTLENETQELRFGRLLANGASYEYNEDLTNWVLAAGSGGGELVSIPGPQGEPGLDGADGTSVYIHYAYANAADGSVGFSTTDSVGKLYIGIYTNYIASDSQLPQTYNWTLIKGADGADGSDGVNGLSGYLHVAYANSIDGITDFSTTQFANAEYIGIYTNFSSSDSTNPADYDWSLIKGADGADGLDGTNGLSSYLHVAYANSDDGSTNFSTSVSAGKSYIGTYTNFVASDSQDPGVYSWSLVKGADGADGSDGANGVSAYLHIAYATSADGSTGFSTSISTNKTHIGQYTNSTLADSEIYTDYSWTLIKGADGADGTDGTDGLQAYLHIAYALSADGSVDFSTIDSTDKTHIGTYSNNTLADSENYLDYNWTLIKGADGSNGTDGVDGTSAYLHLAYANSADGAADFSTTYLGTELYMGQYTDSLPTDSEVYTDYIWFKVVGTDGTDGVDGDQLYFHTAYATAANGSTGFSTTDPTGATYLGTYTDTILADSSNPASYTWAKFAGTDGLDGADGTSVVLKGSVATVGALPAGAIAGDLWVVLADGDGYVSDGAEGWSNVGQIQGPAGATGAPGSNAYVHFAYSTSSDGQTAFSTTTFTGALYIGQYTDFTVTDSTNYLDYTWTLFAGADGADGTDGTDGISAYIHYAYATAADGSTGFSTTYVGGETYIGYLTDNLVADSTNYLDYEWSIFKGSDGIDGNDGANGLSAYIHYAYATSVDGSVGFSTTYTGTEAYVGYLTDFIETDSTNYLDYEWSLFRGSDGANGSDGADGISAYAHYAYATAADGSAGFSTSYLGGETYVGFYTDSLVADSTNYLDYEWALFTGADGIDGNDGADGLPSYVHYAYATAPNGAIGFSTSYTGVESYVGFYTDFTLADSVNYLDYEWSLFKGSDGADGVNGDDGIDALPVYIHYAYATSATGATGFSTTYTGTETHIGYYWDNTLADSVNYLDYAWSLFAGTDGLDGADGANGVDAYLHYAYATNNTGSTGFSLVYTGIETHLGQYTDSNIADSELYTDYEWARFTGADGADGADGLDGTDGTPGTDGLNAYVHYAYATSASGAANFSTTYTGIETYVGVLSDNELTDSLNYLDYEWSLFKGADGANGLDGSDGVDGINGTNGIDGTNGTDGIDGIDGPGIVFRGLWDTNSIYYRTDERADVVEYAGTHYVCTQTTTTLHSTPNIETARWSAFGAEFKSVATDILLAQDVSITKGLVMGSSATADNSIIPFIRSNAKNSIENGEGFYLSGDGTFGFGGDGVNGLIWDGTNLILSGTLSGVDGTFSGSLNAATGSFNGDLVAQSLVINNDITVGHDIIVGTGGTIHTLGKDTLTDVTGGFYLGDDGSFAFGSETGKKITFIGGDLAIVDEFVELEYIGFEEVNDTTGRATFRYANNYLPGQYTDVSIVPSGAAESWTTLGVLSYGASSTFTRTVEYGKSYDIRVSVGNTISSPTLIEYSKTRTFSTPNPFTVTFTDPVWNSTYIHDSLRTGGASKTRVGLNRWRVDVSMTFYLKADITANGTSIITMPSGYRPVYSAWGFLPGYPGTDYETTTAPYFEIESSGGVKIQATTTAEDPITIAVSYFVNS